MYLIVCTLTEGISFNLPLVSRRNLSHVNVRTPIILNKQELIPEWESILQMNNRKQTHLYWRDAVSAIEAKRLVEEGYPKNLVESSFDDVDDGPKVDDVLPKPVEDLELITDPGNETEGTEESAEETTEESTQEVTEPEVTEPEVETNMVTEEKGPELKYPREVLAEMSMSELRVVGKEFGQKARGFDELLEEILVAQTK